MSNISDSLFKLVKSMSSQECTEFCETLKKNRGRGKITHYQRLFEEIVASEDCNELELKERLKRVIPAKSFPVIKNQLQEKLIDFLRTKEPESGLNKIHKMLDEVEVLFNRQLYEEADELCVKIIKEAILLDDKHFILEANRWRLFIVQRIVVTDRQKQVESIRAYSLQLLDAIKLTMAIGNFYSEVVSNVSQHINLRSEKFTKKIDEWKQHPYFNYALGDENLGFYGNCYLAMAKNILYKMSGQFEESYEMERYVWQIFQSNWKFYYRHKKKEVTATMCNYLEALSKTKHWDEMDEHLNFIEHLLNNEEKGNHYIQAYYMVFKLMHTINKKGSRLSGSDLMEFERYYTIIRELPFIDIVRTYQGYMSSAYYFTGRYNDAIAIQKSVIDAYSRNEVRLDLFEHARISYLVFSFTSIIAEKRWSKREIELFASQANSYHETVRKKPNDEDYHLEEKLLKLFRKLDQNTTSSELLKHLLKTEKELESLFQDPSSYLVLLQTSFDYKEWIDRCKRYLQKSST